MTPQDKEDTLIRADQQAKVAEQIAQAIEADKAHMAAALPLCVGAQDAYNRAASIARRIGGAQ